MSRRDCGEEGREAMTMISVPDDRQTRAQVLSVIAIDVLGRLAAGKLSEEQARAELRQRTCAPAPATEPCSACKGTGRMA